MRNGGHVSDDLAPTKGTGSIDSGAFFIRGQKVAEISSDVKIDINAAPWLTAAGFVSGYAPVRLFLGTLSLKKPEIQELTIFGGHGDDTLSESGKKQDFLFGGGGDDLLFDNKIVPTAYNGGDNEDTVDYFLTLTKGLVASLANPSLNTGDAKGDTYKFVENLRGGLGDDKLYGDAKPNTLFGELGSDTLIGGGGRDRLEGGDTNSAIAATNFASYETALSLRGDGRTGVVASLGDPTRNTGDAKGDVYKDIQGLIGSDFNDRLTGDKRSNTLYGGSGDDTLVGGAGTDTLWGDKDEFGVSAADTFLFLHTSERGDTIKDFDVFDHIGVSRAGFGLSKSFAINDTTLVVNAAPKAVGTGPAFLYNTANNRRSFDADGSGAGKAFVLAFLEFDSQRFLDVNDFTLI